MKIYKYFLELKEKIPNWKKDIYLSNVKGTGIEGIAHKASSRFELILREALIKYIDICALKNKYYEKYPNDIIDKLTLGDVIHKIKFLGSSFKTSYNYCKITQGKIIPYDKLFKINDLRKLLEHYPEENEPELIKNTIRLLDHIYNILGHPFFNVLQAKSKC